MTIFQSPFERARPAAISADTERSLRPARTARQEVVLTDGPTAAPSPPRQFI